MRDMLATATTTAKGLGVELVDVRVKQVEFPDDVRNSVYQQMREERGRIAAERRALLSAAILPLSSLIC